MNNISEVQELVATMANNNEYITSLATKAREEVTTLKRCCDEAEAMNDELIELLKQSLARNDRLLSILEALIKGEA